jgi:serine/threonine protein kinase/Tol biopolymer transport system component
MTLTAGTRLGPYEILAPLGAGGMGEVYRARDTRLKRDVALKVLAGAAIEDSGRFRRFQTEAQSTAALSHPNIVAVYDIGQEDRAPYIVSELVTGGTLTSLLARGPLPTKKLLDLAIPIAEGLAAAHARGIVHRDLKPDNILLTSDGSPKIADFGLAKYFRPTQDEEGSQLTTLTDDQTKEGTIVGTVSYMSPEQAKAEPVDLRSDQFSFGSVLYEMATGKRAFRRATTVQTLAAIVQEEPEPVASINPKIPAPLRWVVEQCLAKEPKNRYASTEDLARDLARVRDHIAEVSGSGEAPAMARRRKRSFWAVAAAAATLIAMVLAASYLRRPPQPSTPIRASLILPEKTFLATLALSPDGKRLAFTVDTSLDRSVLWIRRLDEGTAQQVMVRGDPIFPFWSPDSRFVAFFSDGKLRKVDAGGGTIQTICATDPGSQGAGGTWGPDGTIVFAAGMASALYRVASTGGQPVQVTKLDASRHETSHRFPSFLPDGRHFLYMAMGFGSAPEDPPNAIRVASLDGKLDKALVQTNFTNSGYARGHLLYVREGTLLAQPFDPGRLEIAGPPVPIVSHVRGPMAGSHPFSAADRLLVFAEMVFRPSTLLWLDRLGNVKGSLGEPSLFGIPRLSPNGRRVAVDVIDPSRDTADVWIYDIETGARTKFGAVFGSMDIPAPVWSPESDRLFFASDRKTRGHFSLFVRRIDREGEELLLESSDQNSPEDWSSDGRFVSFMTVPGKGRRNFQIWILSMTGERKAFPFATEALIQEESRFSPDGRWIAYKSNESGTNEIYVRAFPGPGGKWQVSTDGGTDPRWRRDGKELFYLSLDRKLMTVPVGLDGAFQAGRPAPLFAVQPILRISAYDVAPDGRRFLVKSPSGEQGSPPLTLLTDWTALLRKD